MMRKCAVFIFLCILLMSGCRQTDTVYTGDGWGNTTGNVVEGGYIAKGDDGYYFYLDDEYGPGLHHMDETGEITRLRRGLAYEINVVGDRVYFINGAPGPICSISTDGKHFKVINRNRCDKLHVNPSCMVYRSKDNLCIADGKGKSERILASNVLGYVIHNDTIVFVQYHTDQDGIYQIGLNGSNLTYLFNDIPQSLASNGKSIYYSVYTKESQYQQESAGVYQIDENGETIPLPPKDRIWNMNATKDYVFYRNQTEGGDLYRMNLDGTNQVCLLEGNCCDINVLDDFVLFRAATVTKGAIEESGLHSVRNDGTNLKLWTGDIEPPK